MLFGLGFGDLLVIYVCYHFCVCLQFARLIMAVVRFSLQSFFETPPTLLDVI